MSVYTPVEPHELEEFLRRYALGTLLDFSGISAGIENTNYFVTTSHGQFVLTLFEKMAAEELPYFLDLMAFLAEHDVPSAHPMATTQGGYSSSLNGKPATLVKRLSGSNVEHPLPTHCAAVGAALGHMHSVGQSFSGQRDNGRGPDWRHTTMEMVLPRLVAQDASIVLGEMHSQQLAQKKGLLNNLPHGVIHADLFRDNALFVDDLLTGIIDFYYACNDVLLYDLAITVNDWCSDSDGSLDTSKLQALLSAYQQQRPLQPQEHDAWPVMLRAAALRFWLSRLHDMYFPRQGQITHTKDPEVFKRILLQRRLETHQTLLG